MRHTAVRLGVVVYCVLTVVTACGRRETPEQRLERLRLAHDIFPIASQTIRTNEGEPTLLVDLQVSNRGAEHLGQLTVLVRVRGEHGTEKALERVTLDLSQVRPGVGVQLPAIVPGVELGEQDEVTVELESGLDASELHSLPEWAEVAAAPR